MSISPDQIDEGLQITLMCIVFISHLIAIFGTPKWLPAWLATLINVIAANYGKAKNSTTKKDSQ